jgi:tRNA 2-thiouridine synthesizing protein E
MGSRITDANDPILNEEGFLADFSAWDEEVADRLAEHEGLGRLDSKQKEIVKMMREHYLRHGSFPILASICRKAGNQPRDCVTQQFSNPMLAWKLAGLPKPANVFFTSFDGEHYFANPFY